MHGTRAVLAGKAAASAQAADMGVLLLRAKRVASLCMRALLRHSIWPANGLQAGLEVGGSPEPPEAAVATIELLTGVVRSTSY